jgi:hypothetical protein
MAQAEKMFDPMSRIRKAGFENRIVRLCGQLQTSLGLFSTFLWIGGHDEPPTQF